MASLVAFFTFSTITLSLGLLSLTTGVSVSVTRQGLSIPALFAFGDSLADVGNNNYLNLTVNFKSNYPHYGIDFPGRVATGRFSNGFNGIDYIAQNLGFEKSPPPYLSIKNTKQMLQGVSFASAGSGILETTNIGTINLATQVKYFKNTIKALKKKLGSNKAKDSLEKSLCIVAIGSNDMINYYGATRATNNTANTQFISNLIDKYIDHLTAIYNLGARKIAISGSGYPGCAPYFRNYVPSGDCIEVLNQLSVQFNTIAKQRLQQLSNQLAGFKYSYSDWYNIISHIRMSPRAFGFTELRRACCGAGKFNGAVQCNPNTTYCSNRDEYMSWDWFHPSQALHKQLSKFSLYASTNFVTPINFKQLAGSLNYIIY